MTTKTDYQANLKAELIKGFAAITTPGSFAAWEALPTTPPAGLSVDGVGQIAMPLSEGQIRELIAKAHQAPYGHRSETLVDLSVRNTWEINGNQLSFLDPAWQGYLLKLSKTVASKLGIMGPIRAELYKMLIYEKGAMFKAHTEKLLFVDGDSTEKIPGMFGTLIICLPSAHTGGEVLVRHNHASMILRTSDATQSFACWYSDVSHEVLPVQSGYRCVLTFNLATCPDQTRPAAAALELQKVPLRNALECWLRDSADHNATHVPSHLYHALDHEYTEASMSARTLKAKDWAQVRALQDLALQRPFEIFLALLEKKEDGDVELNFPEIYDDHSAGDDEIAEIEDEEAYTTHKITKVYDISYTVKSLRTLDGTTIASNYPLNMNFCLVENPFHEVEFTAEEYEPYIGNEGPCATHFYHRSALVMVPRDHRFVDFLVTCVTQAPRPQDNFDSVLSYLKNIFAHPSDPIPLLDAMATLFEAKPRYGVIRDSITELLKTALNHNHHKLFQAVATHHQDQTPLEFFDWTKARLDTLRDEDRTEKYQIW
ncbi:hypothetical protein PGT21_006957 [Puccinia graminis f. sp. tritici]|uniref:Uncharacterized protein n=1 Tax=Puccinia graminis f. sp. tritici TaxID=56615 RepID=A0A5B0MQJ5_PUCGR|nr:hypothetical protein PGT21_006957 [Puccinia graminis f. sp. tritici]